MALTAEDERLWESSIESIRAVGKKKADAAFPENPTASNTFGWYLTVARRAMLNAEGLALPDAFIVHYALALGMRRILNSPRLPRTPDEEDRAKKLLGQCVAEAEACKAALHKDYEAAVAAQRRARLAAAAAAAAAPPPASAFARAQSSPALTTSSPSVTYPVLPPALAPVTGAGSAGASYGSSEGGAAAPYPSLGSSSGTAAPAAGGFHAGCIDTRPYASTPVSAGSGGAYGSSVSPHAAVSSLQRSASAYVSVAPAISSPQQQQPSPWSMPTWYNAPVAAAPAQRVYPTMHSGSGSSPTAAGGVHAGGGGAGEVPLTGAAWKAAAALSAPRLRNVRVSGDIIPMFSHLAAPNTYAQPRGVETCGVLAGPAGGRGSGDLRITHVIVPKQVGHADDCEMVGEEELLNYCLDHGLMSLGWIHTHPSQTCFLSSMDLHTHAGWQSMLPEAIAIVIAPTDPMLPYSAFRLTDDPSKGTATGLDIIQSCPRTGFHPHNTDPPGLPLYETCPHLIFDAGPEAKLQIVDLR